MSASRGALLGLALHLACTPVERSTPPAQAKATSKSDGAARAVPSAEPAARDAAPGGAGAGLVDPAPVPAGPLPLEAPGEYLALDVEGFRPAVVAVPLGATARRPVVIALHGNYDRPEWQCEVWRGITGAHPFILCPRGIPRGDAPKSSDRWEYGALKKTAQEIDAGLLALAQRFPDHVDPGPVVFTGFSLGAILGVHIVTKAPGRFSRMVLTEGGQAGWSRTLAEKLAEQGGRVIFACGQGSCQASSRAPRKLLESAGVGARIVSGGNVGHDYGGKVAAAIAEQWAWLVEGDARFSAAP